MTDDRSAKKAARARMAATGEPYSTARRAVQTGPDRPAPLARPPAIDPREHAVHSRHWGVQACYLVRYEGRYSAWITSADPGDPSQAYGMPSESAGRAFVDAWQATNLLHTPWDERIATIFLLSPSTRNGILYEAAVVNVEDSGIWLACFDDTANDGGTRTLGQFGDLGEALEEFAALAERAADRLGSGQAIDKADLFAGVLRYRAATTRADAARAALGDAIRRHQPRADGGDGLRPLWHEAGLPPGVPGPRAGRRGLDLAAAARRPSPRLAAPGHTHHHARHPHRRRPPLRPGQLPGHGRRPLHRDRPGRPPGRVGVRHSGR